MREILISLQDEEGDESAPDVWLTHLESGWCLSVFRSGLLQLEADAPDEPVRELAGKDLSKALQLWIALAQDDLERLFREDWIEVR